MATIDVDKLHGYLTDHAGTAAHNGFPATLLRVMDIEDMDGFELCQKGADMGIDLRDFEI